LPHGQRSPLDRAASPSASVPTIRNEDDHVLRDIRTAERVGVRVDSVRNARHLPRDTPNNGRLLITGEVRGVTDFEGEPFGTETANTPFLIRVYP